MACLAAGLDTRLPVSTDASPASSDEGFSYGLRGFLGALISAGPGRLVWVILVQAGAGLGQAVGVLLLVPLLGAVGVRASNSVSRFTDDALRSVGVRPTLLAVLGIYVLVAGATAALNGYQTVLATRYRLEFVDALRVRLYASVAQARWRYLMGLRRSSVLAVLTTNVNWVTIGTLGALQVAVSLIVIVAQLAAAIRVSAPVTGLAIVVGVILVGVVWPLVRRSRRLGGELVGRNQELLSVSTGFLDGLKLAKAFGREDAHISAFDDAVAAARASQIGFARASGAASAVQAGLTALLLAGLVYVAVRSFQVATGSLLVVAFVFTRVISQLTTVQTSIQQVASGLPAFDEVVGLIEQSEAEREPVGSASRPARVGIGEGIALEDVHFAYPQPHDGQAEALTGITLEIPAGTIFALAGPSGAGKSTTADLLAGLIRPTRGQIVVDGQPLSGERMLGWRRSVAIVPQDPFLFHDTIEANLRWACPEASTSELWRALDMAAGGAFVRALPEQLGTLVGDRGMQLSGGERQRITLARALLREPDLLILDEATNALDAENERAIQGALDQLRGRTTILVIAHRLSMIRQADQIVILEAGRIAHVGGGAELSLSPALESLVGQQVV
jgi:ATP-binding cassette subfamily C protein